MSSALSGQGRVRGRHCRRRPSPREGGEGHWRPIGSLGLSFFELCALGAGPGPGPPLPPPPKPTRGCCCQMRGLRAGIKIARRARAHQRLFIFHRPAPKSAWAAASCACQLSALWPWLIPGLQKRPIPAHPHPSRGATTTRFNSKSSSQLPCGRKLGRCWKPGGCSRLFLLLWDYYICLVTEGVIMIGPGGPSEIELRLGFGCVCSSASAALPRNSVPGTARFGAGHSSRNRHIPPGYGLDGELGCHRCLLVG